MTASCDFARPRPFVHALERFGACSLEDELPCPLPFLTVGEVRALEWKICLGGVQPYPCLESSLPLGIPPPLALDVSQGAIGPSPPPLVSQTFQRSEERKDGRAKVECFCIVPPRCHLEPLGAGRPVELHWPREGPRLLLQRGLLVAAAASSTCCAAA